MTIADKLQVLQNTKEQQRQLLKLNKNVPFNQYYLYMQPWSELDFFRNGEQGLWFDPSDLSTLYQDINGTTPVTKDGDPVGLMRDKSGNKKHATQTEAACRPIYRTDGKLHWLEFDGVDDYLKVTGMVTETSPAMICAFNSKLGTTGFKPVMGCMESSSLLYTGVSSNFLRIDNLNSETDMPRIGKTCVDTYLDGRNSSYINAKGDTVNISTGVAKITDLLIGTRTSKDLNGKFDFFQLLITQSKKAHNNNNLRRLFWFKSGVML